MSRAVAIVQARTGSTRLPGKVLMPLAGRPMLARVVERVAAACHVDAVVVATSDKPSDATIVHLCEGLGVACFAGSELDVLDRYHAVAVLHDADPVIRITADCPLIDPEIIDHVVERYAQGDVDFAASAAGAHAGDGPRLPDGLSAECMSMAALDDAWLHAQDAADREHVTPWVARSAGAAGRAAIVAPHADLSRFRLTVDHRADYELVRSVYDALGPGPFGLAEVVAFLDEAPTLAASNRLPEAA
jgi:spore coat polysaccharide biosynthesis protein SpsF